jgi:uncharacterized protein DUF4389
VPYLATSSAQTVRHSVTGAGTHVAARKGMYPVSVEFDSPPRFERVQLLLRILLAIVLGWIGITAGKLVLVLYGVLPVLAAIVISAEGVDRFRAQIAPRLSRVLAWLIQLSAYMTMTVDQFPTGGEYPVKVDIRLSSAPTVGSTLARLVTSIPSGLVLMLLWFVSNVLWIVAAFFVLFACRIPESIVAFQRGVVRYQARLVAYHASLVDEYPPFDFDTSFGHREELASASSPQT